MRTEDLITMLSTNVEPVDHRRIARNVGLAVAAGAAVALASVFVLLGPRADLTTAASFTAPLLKAAFAFAILVPGVDLSGQAGRPGGERKSSRVLVALPFMAIMLLAAIGLAFEPRSHWSGKLLGDEWLECPDIDPVHCHRAVFPADLDGAADGADQSCAHRRVRRPHRRLP